MFLSSTGHREEIRGRNASANADAGTSGSVPQERGIPAAGENSYYSDPCACGHRRHTHGIGGCWASGCKCDLPYLLIPHRVIQPQVPKEGGTFAA